MKHSKKVARIVRIMERQYKLQAKATAIIVKIQPRIDRINAKFDKKKAPLFVKIDALYAQRSEALAKVSGAERAEKYREKSRRLEQDIKVRLAALNGGELAALQAAKVILKNANPQNTEKKGENKP